VGHGSSAVILLLYAYSTCDNQPLNSIQRASSHCSVHTEIGAKLGAKLYLLVVGLAGAALATALLIAALARPAPAADDRLARRGRRHRPAERAAYTGFRPGLANILCATRGLLD
jgi:hypothetical protein